MAISNPVFIGSASTTAIVSSLALTTTQNVPAGALIVVTAGALFLASQTVTSVTDSAGNTYTHAVGTFANNMLGDMWYCQNALALASSSTITVNFSGSTLSTLYGTVVGAAYCTGVVAASAIDKTNHTEYGTASTTPSSGSTGTLTQASEVAFGWVFGYTAGAQPTITEGAGFTNLFTYIEGSGNQDAGNFGYQVVNATTALNYQPTVSPAMLAASDIATFKGAAALIFVDEPTKVSAAINSRRQDRIAI